MNKGVRSALTALEVRLVVSDDRHLLGQRALTLLQHLSDRLRHLCVAGKQGNQTRTVHNTTDHEARGYGMTRVHSHIPYHPTSSK